MYLVSFVSLSTGSVSLELREGKDLWDVMRHVYMEIMQLGCSLISEEDDKKKFIDRIEKVGTQQREFYSKEENAEKQNWNVFEIADVVIEDDKKPFIAALPIFASETLDAIWCIQKIEMEKMVPLFL